MKFLLLVLLLCASALAAQPHLRSAALGLRQYTNIFASVHERSLSAVHQAAAASRNMEPMAAATANCQTVMTTLPNCSSLGDLTKNISSLNSGCASSCLSFVRNVLSSLTTADQLCIDAFGDNVGINNLTLNMKVIAYYCSSNNGQRCGDELLFVTGCSNYHDESSCNADTSCAFQRDSGCNPIENVPFFNAVCSPCVRQFFIEFTDFFGEMDQTVGGIQLSLLTQLFCSEVNGKYCVLVVEDHPSLVDSGSGYQLDAAATDMLCTNDTIGRCVGIFSNFASVLIQQMTFNGWTTCLNMEDGSDKAKYTKCLSDSDYGGQLLAGAQIGRVLDSQCTTNSSGFYCFASDVSNPNDPFTSCLNDLLNSGSCDIGCDGNVTQFVLDSGCCGGSYLSFASTVVNVSFPHYNGTFDRGQLPYLGGVSPTTFKTCLGLTTQQMQAASFTSCESVVPVSSGSGTTAAHNVSASMYFNMDYDAYVQATGGDFTDLDLSMATDLATITGLAKTAFHDFVFYRHGSYSATTRLFRQQSASGLGVTFQVSTTQTTSALSSTITTAVAQGASFDATLASVQSTCSTCVSGTTLTPTGVSISAAVLPLFAAALLATLSLLLFI
jgi:hypothetical protein